MVIVACSIGAAHFSHWAGTRGGFTVEDGDVKEMFHTLETLTLNSITEQVSLASI